MDNSSLLVSDTQVQAVSEDLNLTQEEITTVPDENNDESSKSGTVKNVSKRR